MTTHLVPPGTLTEPPEVDLDDFMAGLDAELAAPTNSRPKAAQARRPPPPIIQQWFPHRTILVVTHQHCRSCTYTGTTVEGIFLENIHRNGAIQRLRHTGEVPEDYRYLPRAILDEPTYTDVCQQCWSIRAPERPVSVPTLTRSLPPEEKI